MSRAGIRPCQGRNIMRSASRLGIPARRKQLAACMVAVLGLGGIVETAAATTRYVSNCNDAYDPLHPQATWLRQQVAAASSGDTIDMTGLTCSTITLTNGSIPVTVDNLSIKGPTLRTLTVLSNNATGIFHHTGAGTLTVTHLEMANGYPPTSPQQYEGGCIRSDGNLYLRNDEFSNCYGGATYSIGSTELDYSVV